MNAPARTSTQRKVANPFSDKVSGKPSIKKFEELIKAWVIDVASRYPDLANLATEMSVVTAAADVPGTFSRMLEIEFPYWDP